jgi:hypothetical protein
MSSLHAKQQRLSAAWALLRAQPFGIGKILQPSGSELILNHVFTRDDARGNSVDCAFDAVLPRLVADHAIDALKNIDSFPGLSHLEGRAVGKVRRRHTRNRRAESRQSSKDGLSVLRVRPEKEIEIFGCSRFRVHAERMTADNQVLDGVRVKRFEDVLQVLRQVHRISS